MKHLKNYEQFNEGKLFRGAAKTVNIIGSGLKSLGNLITLNWKGLVYNIKSISQVNKMIDILDLFRDESAPFWMKDKIEFYKNKYGRDILSDIEEMRKFISESPMKIEKKEKYKSVLDSVKKTIDDALLEDEGFKDTLQDLKNKIVDLSNMSKERGYDSGIEYPEDWFDKPISQMEEKDLRIEMDKALDNNDMIKARFIGKYLNKNFDNNEKV
jgi:hypothetical protein